MNWPEAFNMLARKLILPFLFFLNAAAMCNAGQDSLSAVVMHVKLIDKEFNKETITTSEFVAGQLVPLTIALEFADPAKVQPGDYITIEEVAVYFVENYVNLKNKQTMKGHLVIMSVYWPDHFPLTKGSRIVIIAKYNHHKENAIIDGQVVQEIKIGGPDDRPSRVDSLLIANKIMIKPYNSRQDSTKLNGGFYSITRGEKWKIMFNDRLYAEFQCKNWTVEYFGVQRQRNWYIDREITEFKFYRRKFFGWKKIAVKIPYDSSKKFLIIKRNPKGSIRKLFEFEWTDTDPTSLDISDIFPGFKKRYR